MTRLRRLQGILARQTNMGKIARTPQHLDQILSKRKHFWLCMEELMEGRNDRMMEN